MEDAVAIERVGVVGAGTMGVGIAEVFVRAGLATTLVDVDPAALVRAKRRLREPLAAGPGNADRAVGALSFSGSLRAVADCDLVIEAIVESETDKTELFRSLGDVARTDAVLASNTSSIPIVRLARATSHPRRMLGVHFFNPAPVQPLVEVVPSLATSETVLAEVIELCEQRLAKHVVQSDDRAGFVVNTLLIPFVLSAIRMLESGFASASAIDDSMRYACAHSMGPLALSDLMGLDTVKSVAEVLFEEYGDAQFAVPLLLHELVGAGRLGRKSGEGFYTYESKAS
jgi:3-hydroxybutyryl-CoA dehydrogenase